MWHIARNDCRLDYGDGRLIVRGQTLTVEGEIALCDYGLHACERLIDALAYAKGTVICKVELGDDAHTEEDKAVSRKRTCLAMTTAEDGERIMRQFARWCALDVAHVWEMPGVVRQFLETGDESLRNTARATAWNAIGDAAWATAWNATWNAAWDAAWSAARYAARATARDAAWATAWNATGYAAWDAAWYAASHAAWAAARATAWNATGYAARDAARNAARNAAWERYNAKLIEMVLAAMQNQAQKED